LLSQLHIPASNSPVLQAKEGLDSAAALPVALWAKILQHVPQQHRLTQCALVCAACAAGAAQATVHLVHTVQQPDAAQALQSWLALHAGEILTIKMTGKVSYSKPKLQLQLPLSKLTQLQHLQLKGFKLQLLGDEGTQSSSPGAGSGDSSAEGSSSYAATGSLCSLQYLELEDIELANVSSLLQVTNAPQLHSLLMTGIAWTQQGAAAAMPGLL
jgi:hypothetical protein